MLAFSKLVAKLGIGGDVAAHADKVVPAENIVLGLGGVPLHLDDSVQIRQAVADLA